jgi:hypothetical protein
MSDSQGGGKRRKVSLSFGRSFSKDGVWNGGADLCSMIRIASLGCIVVEVFSAVRRESVLGSMVRRMWVR